MSGLLINERFVAVFPSLVRTLGSLESAVILQHLHFNADETGQIRVSMQQISDETGIAQRTVERKVKWLRDEGWVTAERTSSYDATLTYRIDPAKVADSTSPNAGIDPAKVADSEPAKVADSSTKKEEVTTGAVTPGRTARTRPMPQPHDRCRIPSDFAPSRDLITWLRQEYPLVDLRSSCDKFVAHHMAEAGFSTNWSARFVSWVIADQRYAEEHSGGTDDLGIPKGQRPSRNRALQPGDEGYFDPSDYIDPKGSRGGASSAAEPKESR